MPVIISVVYASAMSGCWKSDVLRRIKDHIRNITSIGLGCAPTVWDESKSWFMQEHDIHISDLEILLYVSEIVSSIVYCKNKNTNMTAIIFADLVSFGWQVDVLLSMLDGKMKKDDKDAVILWEVSEIISDDVLDRLANKTRSEEFLPDFHADYVCAETQIKSRIRLEDWFKRATSLCHHMVIGDFLIRRHKSRSYSIGKKNIPLCRL